MPCFSYLSWWLFEWLVFFSGDVPNMASMFCLAFSLPTKKGTFQSRQDTLMLVCLKGEHTYALN